jgi:hypothetical protein
MLLNSLSDISANFLPLNSEELSLDLTRWDIALVFHI